MSFNKIVGSLIFIDFTKIINETITNSNTLSFKNNFIEIVLEYDYEYLTTLNETYRKSIIEGQGILSYLLPEISFSLNNYENPLKYNMNSNHININQNFTILNEILYTVTKIEQDENFLFNKKMEIESPIHFQKKNENILPRKGYFKILAGLKLYLDGLYFNKYTRVYKKAPEILAEVSGIIQPLIILFSFLIEYFTRFNLDNFFIDNFLNYLTKDNNKEDKIIWKYQNFKDFKNQFKNVSQTDNAKIESTSINKIACQNSNRNRNEKSFNFEFVRMNNIEELSENREIQDLSNRILICENKKILNKKNFLNEINIELVDKFKIENNKRNDKIIDENYKHIPNKVDLNNNNQKNEMQNDSFNFIEKKKNNFPNISFIEYYFPCLISKKNKDFNHRIKLLKIFKYFSKQILQKLDFFYYLKLVRGMELYKNITLRKKFEKKKLQFLLKSLYFVRDCDLEYIAQK